MAEKVTDEKLRGIINSEINNSIGFMGSNLTSQRKKSMEYYMGEKLGTEIDGRSQVVSTDVADTIETILPNLCNASPSSLVPLVVPLKGTKTSLLWNWVRAL